jgi:hypothetical protein
MFLFLVDNGGVPSLGQTTRRKMFSHDSSGLEYNFPTWTSEYDNGHSGSVRLVGGSLWSTKRQLASQERLYSKELVSSSVSLLIYLFSFLGWHETVYLVRLPLFGLLYRPRMINDDDCGAIGGMRIVRENRSTRRKPAPVPLYPLEIPHDLTWAKTRATAVGSQRLTAWAMAQSSQLVSYYPHIFAQVFWAVAFYE